MKYIRTLSIGLAAGLLGAACSDEDPLPSATDAGVTADAGTDAGMEVDAGGGPTPCEDGVSGVAGMLDGEPVARVAGIAAAGSSPQPPHLGLWLLQPGGFLFAGTSSTSPWTDDPQAGFAVMSLPENRTVDGEVVCGGNGTTIASGGNIDLAGLTRLGVCEADLPRSSDTLELCYGGGCENSDGPGVNRLQGTLDGTPIDLEKFQTRFARVDTSRTALFILGEPEAGPTVRFAVYAEPVNLGIRGFIVRNNDDTGETDVYCILDAELDSMSQPITLSVTEMAHLGQCSTATAAQGELEFCP